MTSLMNYLLYFTSLPNSLMELARIFKLHIKIVYVLIRCDMPLKNSSVISNFDLIREIKRWKNCVIHISSSQVSIV